MRDELVRVLGWMKAGTSIEEKTIERLLKHALVLESEAAGEGHAADLVRVANEARAEEREACAAQLANWPHLADMIRARGAKPDAPPCGTCKGEGEVMDHNHLGSEITVKCPDCEGP